MAARKAPLPFDLAALRANGVTRVRYKAGNVEIELELAPPPPAAEVERAAAPPAWAADDEDQGPDPEDEGDPRFLLERISEANRSRKAV